MGGLGRRRFGKLGFQEGKSLLQGHAEGCGAAGTTSGHAEGVVDGQRRKQSVQALYDFQGETNIDGGFHAFSVDHGKRHVTGLVYVRKRSACVDLILLTFRAVSGAMFHMSLSTTMPEKKDTDPKDHGHPIIVPDVDRERIGRLYAEWQLAVERAGNAEHTFRGSLAALMDRVGADRRSKYDMVRGVFLLDEMIRGENG